MREAFFPAKVHLSKYFKHQRVNRIIFPKIFVTNQG